MSCFVIKTPHLLPTVIVGCLPWHRVTSPDQLPLSLHITISLLWIWKPSWQLKMQIVPKVGSSDVQFMCPLTGSWSCRHSTATEWKKTRSVLKYNFQNEIHRRDKTLLSTFTSRWFMTPLCCFCTADLWCPLEAISFFTTEAALVSVTKACKVIAGKETIGWILENRATNSWAKRKTSVNVLNLH